MGAELMIVLFASISVLNWMRAATGSQCRELKRRVTWALSGSQKTSLITSNIYIFILILF